MQGLNLVKPNISASDSRVEEFVALTEIAFLFFLFDDLSTAIENEKKKTLKLQLQPRGRQKCSSFRGFTQVLDVLWAFLSVTSASLRRSVHRSLHVNRFNDAQVGKKTESLLKKCYESFTTPAKSS